MRAHIKHSIGLCAGRHGPQAVGRPGAHTAGGVAHSEPVDSVSAVRQLHWTGRRAGLKRACMWPSPPPWPWPSTGLGFERALEQCSADRGLMGPCWLLLLWLSRCPSRVLHTHARTCTYTHTDMHLPTYTYTHAPTHLHAPTHTCTSTHIELQTPPAYCSSRQTAVSPGGQVAMPTQHITAEAGA